MNKVISFSLYGDNPVYWFGALENIKLASEIYPDWTVRFYIDRNASSKLIEPILKTGAEVIFKMAHGHERMFWRFLACDDSDVMICRDCDSRLSLRELSAVKAWLESDKDFHIMRDHPLHNSLIMGGMWGARNIEGMAYLIDKFPYKHLQGADQLFLSKIIYPQVEKIAMIHDTYHLFNDGVKFPQESRKDFFVGQPFDTENRPL